MNDRRLVERLRVELREGVVPLLGSSSGSLSIVRAWALILAASPGEASRRRPQNNHEEKTVILVAHVIRIG